MALILNYKSSASGMVDYTVNAGNPKFNAAGGVLMSVIGDSATWEDPYFRKGYLGFEGESYISEPQITGGTYSSFLFDNRVGGVAYETLALNREFVFS